MNDSSSDAAIDDGGLRPVCQRAFTHSRRSYSLTLFEEGLLGVFSGEELVLEGQLVTENEQSRIVWEPRSPALADRTFPDAQGLMQRAASEFLLMFRYEVAARKRGSAAATQDAASESADASRGRSRRRRSARR